MLFTIGQLTIMDGTLSNERDLFQNGQECNLRPCCRWSSSLRSLNVIPSSTVTPITTKKVRIKQGTLRYHRNDENKCVDVIKDYENYFNATVLKKVNTEFRGEERYPVEDEFYQNLCRFLTRRRNWGLTFQVRGRSTFMVEVMEWNKWAHSFWRTFETGRHSWCHWCILIFKSLCHKYMAGPLWTVGATNQCFSLWCRWSYHFTLWLGAVGGLSLIHIWRCRRRG